MVPAPHLGVCLKLHTQYGDLQNRFPDGQYKQVRVGLSSGERVAAKLGIFSPALQTARPSPAVPPEAASQPPSPARPRRHGGSATRNPNKIVVRRGPLAPSRNPSGRSALGSHRNALTRHESQHFGRRIRTRARESLMRPGGPHMAPASPCVVASRVTRTCGAACREPHFATRMRGTILGHAL